MDYHQLKKLLEQKFEQFNQKAFIKDDPISIPHQFQKKQDIEIMGFFASIFAWGQRKTIINKCIELIDRMEGEPYGFVLNLDEHKLKKLLGFKHRTFNDSDLLCVVQFFNFHYSEFESFEDAFLIGFSENEPWKIEKSLINFRDYFFSTVDFLPRTKKHISSPAQNSACKRLCMFLRWMVRKDDAGVDFGLWERIPMSGLVCPCDLHVTRVAQKLGLIQDEVANWKTALLLTEKLRYLDPYDPVKYDFSLFGMGLEMRYHL
ncbi:MAG: TIGR02757 family protein [Cytophagales bacterium]